MHATCPLYINFHTIYYSCSHAISYSPPPLTFGYLRPEEVNSSFWWPAGCKPVFCWGTYTMMQDSWHTWQLEHRHHISHACGHMADNKKLASHHIGHTSRVDFFWRIAKKFPCPPKSTNMADRENVLAIRKAIPAWLWLVAFFERKQHNCTHVALCHFWKCLAPFSFFIVLQIFVRGDQSHEEWIKMPSGATWRKEEEEALCWAWLAASEDPIKGTGQWIVVFLNGSSRSVSRQPVWLIMKPQAAERQGMWFAQTTTLYTQTSAFGET